MADKEVKADVLCKKLLLFSKSFHDEREASLRLLAHKDILIFVG